MLRRSLALGLLLLILGSSISAAGLPTTNWAHWRGPSMQGYSDDTKVPLTWGDTQNLVWKTKLPGTGNSTPIVWGDRIFLTASSSDGLERYVLCFRASDGKLLWQQTASRGIPPGKSHSWNGYASASCTTDGTHVYAFFGTPGLFCYDLEGKQVWHHSFGIFTSDADWGTAASPFLYEDLVIQNCDNDGPRALPAGKQSAEAAPEALVALNKRTGKVEWTTRRDMGRGFSTPCLIPTAGGRIDLVLNGPLAVVGYDPKTGTERWRCKRSAGGDQQRFGEPLPVFNSEALFIESGRPGPCQGLRLPGDGDVTSSHVLWTGARKGHRDVASPILVEGLVYAADNKGLLSCIDLKTGKELYTERIGNGKALASPVLVCGKLLFVLDDGVTVVLEPGPKLQIAGRNKLGTGASLDFGASPAIANGRLYLRSQSFLYCIGETK
jgi:outer membrane protein assembly factor BamB